jgi:hypothetical protein
VSDIPYPHSVEVHRRVEDPDDEDAYGNAVVSSELVGEFPAWVQEKSARAKELWSRMGPEVSTHTVFMESRVFAPGDFLVTIPGGGQIGSEEHRILGARDPDGTGDHLEVDTVLVGSYAS